MRTLGIVLAVGCLILLAACGGSSSSNPASTITGVAVTCSPSTVQSGQNSQCTATVTGTGSFSNTVTWTASAGTINASGLFTAPTVVASTLVTVTATSTQDATKSGTANIVVNPLVPANNVQPIAVNSGPEPNTFFAVNEPFVSVTICVPGTSQCQTIDNILVDTGSTGLRLLAGQVTLPLPQEKDANGNPLQDCAVFLDGYTWGNVSAADISMAGEKASGVPIQVILTPSSQPPVPSSCSSQTTGPNEGASVSSLGANGILGIGVFQQDCGPACVLNSTPPPVYYICPSSGCTPVYVALSSQITQPVSLFSTDNNGVVIQLPAVPNGGSLTAAGQIIFGIGTQTNNTLGSAVVLTVPDSGSNAGNITAIYNGNSYTGFIDSGSNGLFFLDANTTGMPVCSGQNNSWYCPNPSPKTFTVTNQGANGATAPASFSIENADTLFNGNNTAFSTLGGPNANTFDFGLSFFYGRNVYSAIENMNTPAGPGPYVAY